MGTAIAIDNRFPNTTAGKLAQQLGWFSLALGTLEVVAAGRLSRRSGCTAGALDPLTVFARSSRDRIMTSPNPAPWVWGRSPAMRSTSARSRGYQNKPSDHVAIAFRERRGRDAIDVMCDSNHATSRRQRRRDYSLGRDFPLARGLARLAHDAVITNDMMTQEALRTLST